MWVSWEALGEGSLGWYLVTLYPPFSRKARASVFLFCSVSFVRYGLTLLRLASNLLCLEKYDDLKLLVLLHPLECWDDRRVPLSPVYVVLIVDPRASNL